MRKVAIVGVEGSGKTVLLAGLAELYLRPDAKGYFLAPKNFRTASYVSTIIGRMRAGKWPSATAEDAMHGLDWTLKRKSDVGAPPTEICELSCLDFAGEIYRRAFVDQAAAARYEDPEQIEKLWEYVARADVLIVLVNLRDVIYKGAVDRRVTEALWVTNGLLDEALKPRAGRVPPRAAIVLSQADRYAAEISKCGGPRGALAKYLPTLSASYDWLDVFAACTVDKTMLDKDGYEIPAPDFATNGLKPIMDWILADGPTRTSVASKHDILFWIVIGVLAISFAALIFIAL